MIDRRHEDQKVLKIKSANSTMKTYNEPTMSYQYGNDEKEFIFCMKGRPFPCLVSPYLPTPTASLIDYNLVRDLGVKMTDLQCQKFSFSGFKMRILGKVSLTAQCIHDGISSGAFHIKANVILDLAKNLDTECVAGTKMAAQLSGNSSPTSPPSTPAPSVPAAASPRTPPPRSSSRPSPRSPRSPPGSTTPQHAASPGYSIPLPRPTIPVFSVCSDGRELSPRTANCRALTAAFKDADLKPNIKLETSALKKADPDGDLVEDDDGKKKYTFTNRVVYQYGHGREKCSRTKCYSLLQIALAKFPNNCGFNKQWRLPEKFSPCGDNCSGGFCSCLKRYQSNNKEGERKRRK